MSSFELFVIEIYDMRFIFFAGKLSLKKTPLNLDEIHLIHHGIA